MNSKNALFLAATLTAFALAILFAVVNKVTTTPIEAAAAPAVQDTATPEPTDIPATDVPTPTALAELGPLEAAQIAANSAKRTDVYSVESFSFNDQNSYKVVFSSGDIVYVAMDRTILDAAKLQTVIASTTSVVTPAQVIVYAVPTAAPVKKHKGGGSGGQPTPPGEHEGGDD